MIIRVRVSVGVQSGRSARGGGSCGNVCLLEVYATGDGGELVEVGAFGAVCALALVSAFVVLCMLVVVCVLVAVDVLVVAGVLVPVGTLGVQDFGCQPG